MIHLFSARLNFINSKRSGSTSCDANESCRITCLNGAMEQTRSSGDGKEVKPLNSPGLFCTACVCVSVLWTSLCPPVLRRPPATVDSRIFRLCVQPAWTPLCLCAAYVSRTAVPSVPQRGPRPGPRPACPNAAFCRPQLEMVPLLCPFRILPSSHQAETSAAGVDPGSFPGQQPEMFWKDLVPFG